MAASSSAELEFGKARRQFKDILQKSLQTNDVDTLLNFIQNYQDEVALEKRAVLDQVLRDILCKMISDFSEAEHLKTLITFAVQAVRQDMCSPSTPFLMMADIFDMLTIERCENIFNLVEDKVTIWKSEPFYESGKNYLLRMCNDLIRRLSKSQNTVFCGRIQLFLSRLFPLSEKSALNLASQFNLENVTTFSKNEVTDEKQEDGIVTKMEVDNSTDQSSSIPIDYHLYSKFWTLQDFFRRPTQCYDKAAWDTFSQYAKDVMAIFSSYKLDDTSSSQKKVAPTQPQQVQNFFAKYLTSKKLLDLQLNDSNFRRYVLVQFLIIFQYLKATVKFKTQAHSLTEEQNDWIRESQQEVTRLLCETPPDGKTFCTAVKQMLDSEEHWNNWKNESCPSFIKEKSKEQQKNKMKTPKRKRIGDELLATGGKSLKLGHPELTRLWNLNPDNMEACKAESRVFLPKLDDFFTNAIEQADPEAMVEEQYKDINDQNFQWKAYRLLARTSPHFFVHAQTPGLPINAHLKDIVDKMAKELNPNQSAEEVKSEVTVADVDEEIKENNEEEEEEDLKNEENDDTVNEAPLLTANEIRTIAEKLGVSWMDLGRKLDIPSDDLTYYKDSSESATGAAVSMLTVWQEEDPDREARSLVREALSELGLSSVLENDNSP